MRPGNPQYRIAETPSGILNSIGLENPGAVEVARRYGVQWAALGVPVIVNVAGYSVEDYVYVVSEMAGTPGVVAYELNVSCPNVKDGMIFGSDPSLAAELTRAVKAETDLPVIVKLTPNAPDVVAVARACEEAGADGVTAINTVLGMRIDTRRRRPIPLPLPPFGRYSARVTRPPTPTRSHGRSSTWVTAPLPTGPGCSRRSCSS